MRVYNACVLCVCIVRVYCACVLCVCIVRVYNACVLCLRNCNVSFQNVQSCRENVIAIMFYLLL